MNAEHLLAHYDRIADAPNAIARLRRFILDLAVRGKLVPQDPRDEACIGIAEADREGKARPNRFAERMAQGASWSALGFPVWKRLEGQ